MPARAGDDRFVEAVKPALEALLNDLQHTTEVLRRAHLGDRHSASRDAVDLEPDYQEQQQITRSRTDKRSTSHHGLDNVETLLNDYSEKRKSYGAESEGGRPTVHALFNELDRSGSRRSVGAPNGSYNDLSRRSPSRDPSAGESLLGTLNSEYSSRHGISTIPKGDCAHCGKPIIGQVVIALSKMWHPEHYVCCECGEELGHRNFFERNGRAYCENDYHEQFSPRCVACHGPIKDRCVTALNKTFHPEHFTCTECGRELGESGFHEKDGRAYCRNDFFRLYAPKCRGCSNAITANFITALGTTWHPDCFVCQECHQAFPGGSFFEHAGRPLCETHYHEARGSLCHSCRRPIAGRCVSALGQKFHPEHFTCSYCSRMLNKGIFKEVNGKPFCHKCYQNTHGV